MEHSKLWDPPELYSLGEIFGLQVLRPGPIMLARDMPVPTYTPPTFTCSHCGVPFTVGTDCGCGAKRPKELSNG